MAKPGSKVHAHIREEATSWFIDFNEGDVDAAARIRFNEWLRRSPEHVRAYLQVSAFWEDADTFTRRPDPDMETLIARAMAQHNIHPFDASAERLKETSSRMAWIKPGLRRRPVALAASILVAMGCAVAAWYGVSSRSTFVAGIGEQRSITLEDGSSIELNSRSGVKVRYTAHRREVDLIEGQALFSVAKDPARPFIVIAGDARVRAVGTQFDVYRRSSGTVVTVIEGRVAVTSKSAASGPIVDAGEQLTVTPQAASPPVPANVAVATAWTEKKLIFKSTPLREVVEEFNRYNRRQLVIRDPQLYGFHVSGVFPSTDSNRMVELLRRRFGVTVAGDGDQIAISRGDDGAVPQRP